MSSIKTNPPIVNPVKAALSPEWKHHEVVPMKQFYQAKAPPGEPLPPLQELWLPMVLLLGDEEVQVEANAYQDTLTIFKGKSPKKDEPSNWDQLLDANRAYWTIYFSARMPEDLNKKWFDSKNEVEKIYSWDSANILMEHYIAIKMTQPCYAKIDFNSPTVFQDIIDQIKKFGVEDRSDFFLNGLTSFQFNQLLKFLVKERESYLPTSGSSGKP